MNNCGLPAKIKTGWESKAKEIVVAIARPANGPLGEMFAASCDPPVSTRIAWASKVKVTVAATEKRVAAGVCSQFQEFLRATRGRLAGGLFVCRFTLAVPFLTSRPVVIRRCKRQPMELRSLLRRTGNGASR